MMFDPEVDANFENFDFMDKKSQLYRHSKWTTLNENLLKN